MREGINIEWSCCTFPPSLPLQHLWRAEVYMQCINTLPSLSPKRRHCCTDPQRFSKKTSELGVQSIILGVQTTNYLLSDTPSLSRSWREALAVLWGFTLPTAGKAWSWSGIPSWSRAGSQVPVRGLGVEHSPSDSSGTRDKELPLTLQGSRPWPPCIWSTPGSPPAFLPRIWH